MTHSLDTQSLVLPIQLLQPLDATHPFSTPTSSGGPHQRLTVSPDPDVGAELDLRPTRLLIRKDSQIRSIWPVHLAGWQLLGWQLHTPAETAGDEDHEPQEPDQADQAELAQAAEALPAPQARAHQPLAPSFPTPAVDPAPTDAPTAAGEAVLTGEAPNFQAMTKAEITVFCASTYGVSLDGSMTKAELVATANALLTAEGDDLAFRGEGTDPEFPDDLL